MTPSMTLVEEGRPKATIVIGKHASQAEQFAAEELQTYLRKISGAAVPIRRDDQQLAGNLILVGHTQPTEDLGVTWEDLGPEGFKIKTMGDRLVLAGKDEQGIQFAAYTFLERYCGVRWLWPGDLGEVIPQIKTIRIGKI